MGTNGDDGERGIFSGMEYYLDKEKELAKHRANLEDKLSPILSDLTEFEIMCRERADRPDFARHVVEAKLSLLRLLEAFKQEESRQAIFRDDF